MQGGTKPPVRGVGQEPLPQDLESLPEPVAQLVPCPSPLLPAGFPPRLQRARLRRVLGAAEARLVGEEPERGEVGVQVLGEDSGEVGFNPRRPREARVVTRNPQREPVRRHSPERGAGRVQDLLQEPEGAPSAPVVAELGQGSVQTRSHRGHDDGNPVAEGEEPHRIHPLADRARLLPCHRREAQRVAQKRLEEPLRKPAGVASGGPTRLHFPEARLGDAPAPGDLVADVGAPSERGSRMAPARWPGAGPPFRASPPREGRPRSRAPRRRCELRPGSFDEAPSGPFHADRGEGAGRHSPLSRRERGFTPIQREMIMRHGQSTFGRSTYTADHVGTREGLDGGAPSRSASLAHPKMILPAGHPPALPRTPPDPPCAPGAARGLVRSRALEHVAGGRRREQVRAARVLRAR